MLAMPTKHLVFALDLDTISQKKFFSNSVNSVAGYKAQLT